MITKSYVIFVAYASHGHYEMNTKMFVAENQEFAEKMAKEWLYQEVIVFFEKNASITTETIRQKFEDESLDNLIGYIHEHSVAHVQTQLYSYYSSV